MKNIFVTGGTGLIGSHLIEELLRRQPDAHIVVLVQSLRKGSYFLEQRLDRRTTMYFGDIRDVKTVWDAIFVEEIDTIFHLAAQTLVPVAAMDPRGSWETNVIGTLNILEAARGKARIQSIVVASTDKVYGRAKFLPYSEEHPLLAAEPYDASKACEDIMAYSYANTYGMPVVISRLANIFGPGDMNMNRIVPGAMRALFTGKPLEIRTNGHLTRDYMYVKDAVNGYLLLEQHAKTYPGQAFNFTTGWNFTAIELLQEIGRAVGRQVPYAILDQPHHEIPAQTLTDQKSRTMLGWKPQSSLDESLRETWKWYEDVFRKDPYASGLS